MWYNLFMKKIYWIIIVLLLALVGAYFFPIANTPTQSFGGTFTPVQSQKFTLAGSGITTSATSIIVNDLVLPDGITPITMGMFGSIGYAVLEPGTSQEENISFTGIIQNTNNTATLTGVSRGLAFTTPYAPTSSLAYGHAGGTYLIFSNSAPFYSQFGVLGNAQTWSGIDTYSVSPIVPTPTTPTQVASKGYVDGVAVAGAPNADTVTKGIVQYATQSQAANSTVLGSTGATLALGNGIATDTPNTATRSLRVLMSDTTGYLNQAWLNLSQAFTFGGAVTINNSLSVTGQTVLSSFVANSTTATSTVNNLKITNNATTTNLTVSNKATIPTLTVSNSCSGCTKAVIVIGTTVTTDTIAPDVTSGSVSCPVGKVVVGGGAKEVVVGQMAMIGSYPINSTTWNVSYVNYASNAAGQFIPYAVCTTP